MLASRGRALGLAIIVALLTVLVGCDASLEPFHRNSGLYSIQGILTLAQDTHYVRIKNLNESVSRDTSRDLDATVTLENLTTGTSKTLADTVVSFDGIRTHNFRITDDIQPTHAYELTVERADGRSARARATMPPITEVTVDADEPVKCLFGASFHFQNVPLDRLVELSVGVPWNDGYNWVDRDLPTKSGFVVWRILEDAFPRRITSNVKRNRYCLYLPDNHFRVAYTHYGPDWPTDSVRTNPVASNVENGLGLFGGLHRDTLTVQIDTVTVQSLF